MTSDQPAAQKGGLPTWAKILIGLVILGIIGVITVCVGSLVFINKMVKDAQDPAAIAQTSKGIADFQTPLPAGYKIDAAFTLMNVGTVIVQHESDKQTLTLISFPKKETDPKSFVDKIIESGVDSPRAKARLEEIKSRGTEKVAGVEMPYVIGKMTNDKNENFEGLVGCLVSPTKDKTILVYGMQPLGTQYNLETTKDFLKTIKSF